MPRRVVSRAHEVMFMPLKSVAKERHHVDALSAVCTVKALCMAAGLDLQACQVVPQARQRALLGLAACPRCLRLVGHKCPLASELGLLRAGPSPHLLRRKV